ncbi:zinc-ribbon domain-containing protein [Butyrivibrio sp. FCS006]|uniref:zinc-ribbon domain-containing protein n=1 Tax=Butyrivibrio sp. FCS006 TaxID=1280684 RepID=UPI0003FC07B5|nr:zinc ribbon domain-containing protein [Butyrivibrio sp. FCS006]
MAQQLKFCPECGAQLNPGVKFCRQCGTKLETFTENANVQNEGAPQSAPVQTQMNSPAQQRSAPAPAQMQAPNIGQTIKSAAEVLKLGDLTAPTTSGEWELIDMAPVQGASQVIGAATSAAEDIVEAVTSPFDTIFKSLLSFVGGIFGTLIKPKNLILAIALGAVWIVCGINRNSDDSVTNLLSFLTFGEGGYDRDGLGVIGGLAGKGTVAVMLSSLLSGGIPNTIKGAAGIFKKSEEKKSIPLFIVGILLGGLGYIAFAGINNVSAITSMAGIAGAVVALQAVGQKDGWIYRIAQSLTAKKINGIRTSQDGKITSLLGGVALGFAIVTIIFIA